MVRDVAAVDRVFADTVGEPLEQHCVEGAADAPLTELPIMWSNNGSDVTDLVLANGTSVTMLAAATSPPRGTAFRVRIDERTAAERGDPPNDYTVSRGVANVNQRTARRLINLLAEPNTTLTGRTNRTRPDANPASNTTMQTIWVDNRVAFHQPAGIERQYVVGVSPQSDHEARVETAGNEPSGSVDASATVFDVTVVRIEMAADA